jgi:hypothetical protein
MNGATAAKPLPWFYPEPGKGTALHCIPQPSMPKRIMNWFQISGNIISHLAGHASSVVRHSGLFTAFQIMIRGFVPEPPDLCVFLCFLRVRRTSDGTV